MFKNSFKAIAIGIFAFSMLSNGLICSATETTAITTDITTSVTTITDSKTQQITTNITTTTSTDVTTTAINTETTTSTTSAITTTTPIETTTSPEITTTTAETTTTPIETTTTTEITTTIPLTDNTQEVSNALTPQEKGKLIQDRVDLILYDTSLDNTKKKDKIMSYLRNQIFAKNLNISQMAELTNNIDSILKRQEEQSKSNSDFYKNYNSLFDNINYKNFNAIENYARNSISSGVKSRAISPQEAIKLSNSVHQEVISRLSAWDWDLINNQSYVFTSKQSLVNQWNESYPDMKGWIYLSNSGIDYPLMQYSEDNNYYLEHSWNGAESSRGAIELDYRCNFGDFIDDTTITNNCLIYGHNLYNDAMFSHLARYKDKSYWETNPYIEISTEQDQRLYKIYACCSIYGKADGTQFKYWDDKYISMDEDTFNEHLALTKQTMLYDTGITPSFAQDIITLQTCDGNDGWRIVIFAKRVK